MSMSFRTYTKCQLLWYKAAHLTISRSVRKAIKKLEKEEDGHDEEMMEHLRWRLAYNLYAAGNYKSAMEMLTALTADEPEEDDEKKNKGGRGKSNKKKKKEPKRKLIHNSFVHQTAGRCAVQLFFTTGAHSHLEMANMHYQQAVEHMEVNLFTMFQLPSLLLEFGRVLEYYGAFESANELYAQILKGFPNFRGYFDALYRTAIVGRHLASLVGDPATKEQMLNKSVDIFQFLLEALPANISDIHVVLLYGRTLELSSSPQVRFRSHAIYHTLFELCQRHMVAGAGRGKGSDPMEWVQDPNTWLQLADECAQAREPLIAKDGYAKFLELKKKYTPHGQHVSAALSAETCVKLAQSAAQYQHFDEAVRYAEIGLHANRFHPEVRSLLSKWSKPHVKIFEQQEHAARKIVSVWKGRCWTSGFREKLKEATVARLEERLRQDRWDQDARAGLAYYARQQYRFRFIFEEACVMRVQRFFRHRKKMWVWQQAQRQHVFTKASEAMRQYQRFPHNAEVRRAVLEIAAHRMAPQNHPIQQARLRILQEGKAVVGIERCMACYKIRREVAKLVQVRRRQVEEQCRSAAVLLQCWARAYLAVRRVQLLFDTRRCRDAAATHIQQFVRKRSHMLFHLVGRVVDRNSSRVHRAHNVLRRRVPVAVKNYFLRREAQAMVAELRRQAEERRLIREEKQRLRTSSCQVIQRFWRNVTNAFWSKVSRDVIKQRRLAKYSVTGTALLAQLHAQHEQVRRQQARQQQVLQQLHAQHSSSSRLQAARAATQSSTAQHPVQYRVPGINQHSEQFLSLARQETVVCGGAFSAADCMMLSMVLRSPACAVRQLLLEEVDETCSSNACFEFDLLAALAKCRSVRAVYVFGGSWTPSFLTALVQLVQVDNPRITTLGVEKIERAGMCCDVLSTHAGRLLCDYFNYSAPGLQELTLHGCALRDSQVELLSKGLEVNSSVRTVCLSLNLLSDLGFVLVFGAVCRNRKSRVERLDFNWNLIQCHAEMRNMLRFYKAHRLNIFMELHLMHNRIYDRYHPVQDLNRRGDAQVLRIFYCPEDVEAARSMTVRHPRAKTGVRGGSREEDADDEDASRTSARAQGQSQGQSQGQYRASRNGPGGVGGLLPGAHPLAGPEHKANFTARLRQLKGKWKPDSAAHSTTPAEQLQLMNRQYARAHAHSLASSRGKPAPASSGSGSGSGHAGLGGEHSKFSNTYS